MLRFLPILTLFLASTLFAEDKAPAFTASQGGGPMLGVAPAIAPPPYRVRWRTKAGDEETRASVANSPIIAGGAVLVPDSNGKLTAFELATGKPRWVYKSQGGFETTPLVVENKVLLGDLDGIFHCISLDKGARIWTFDAQASIHSSANLSPDGKAALFGNDSAEIYAVSIADGKKVWDSKGGDRINACPGIGMGAAFFTGCDARLLALDLKTGEQKFAVDLGDLAPGSPVVLPDRILLGTEGSVQAISPDGKQVLWKYQQTDEEHAMFYSSPACAQGLLIIGCRDRLIHAIDVKTGKRAWAFKTRNDVDAAMTISDGRVYAPSKDKKLYVLDLKTGQKLWEFSMPRSIEAGVAIGNGVIIIADSGGNIVCLEPEKQ